MTVAQPFTPGAAGAKRASQDRVLSATARATIAAALRSLFNFLVLNLVLVVVSLPIVTLPIAINAATVALDRWRVDGEDRVVREFFLALRSRPRTRTTVAVGAPMAAMAVAVEEVHYYAHGGPPVNWVCFGLGSAGLAIAMGTMGYVILLSARNPSAPLPDLWSFCVRLTLQNLFVTGPVFVAEIAGAVLLALVDPALLLIGLPLAFLALLRLTAGYGARRGAGAPKAPVR
jgi:uncharacterized membrane protein YvlD (DUF360 family)